MPRFIANGPVVPDRLVQDLEEDRVVIFCGAGISMGAGLPDYKGLVSHCYAVLGQEPPKDKSPEWLWPDRMLGELEGIFDSHSVRNHVVHRLSQPPTDLAMHKAILRLAQLKRTEGMRLVTTNFDHYFEDARAGMTLGVDYHSGPILPIPRNDYSLSWKSIVYLHGRLNETGSNDHLVLTSADFGRAYLTDAWAARFIARLFSDFTVLFIGYSINDPVLRYMTDAFAAENASLITSSGGPAYIFVSHKNIEPDPEPYRRRNLIPIFYHQYRNHSRLKKTLVAWAKARDDFLTNTTRLIGSIAHSVPKALDPSDTSNLLWAVIGRSDDLGYGARVFAEMEQRPPIEWMDEFERREIETTSIHNETVQRARKVGQPSPDAPPQPISSLFPDADDRRALPLSETAFHLGSWMLRHLDNVLFVERVIAKIGAERRLHPALRSRIRERLNGQHELEDGFACFWRIVSSDGDWALAKANALSRFGLSAVLNGTAPAERALAKQELIDACQPILTLKPSYYALWSRTEDGAPATPPGVTLGEIADAEVLLASEDTLYLAIESINRHAGGKAYWATILPELTQLLTRVLDLYAIAGEADAVSDPSTFQRPSIVPHAQNAHRLGWTQLIEQIWAGWTHIDALDPAASIEMIGVWRRIPYLTFKRLTLAAAAGTPHLTPRQKLELLIHA